MQYITHIVTCIAFGVHFVLPSFACFQVSANDADEGLNGEIRYSFNRQTLNAHGSTFAIDPTSGRITLRRPLDSNDAAYLLVVTALDRGPGAIPGYARVHVTVLDVNNHAPQIRFHHHRSASAGSRGGLGSRRPPGEENARLEVAENRPPGSFVGHLTVDDPDSGDGGVVDCMLTDGGELFALSPMPMPTSSTPDTDAGSDDDSTTSSSSTVFQLVTRRPLDREERAEHAVAIECRDRGRQPGPLSSELQFAVRVTDENDNAPTFVQSAYSVNVRENGTVSGQPMPILRVRATDHDTGDNALVSYRLATGSERSDGDSDDIARSAVCIVCIRKRMYVYMCLFIHRILK